MIVIPFRYIAIKHNDNQNFYWSIIYTKFNSVDELKKDMEKSMKKYPDIYKDYKKIIHYFECDEKGNPLEVIDLNKFRKQYNMKIKNLYR